MAHLRLNPGDDSSLPCHSFTINDFAKLVDNCFLYTVHDHIESFYSPRFSNFDTLLIALLDLHIQGRFALMPETMTLGAATPRWSHLNR